VQGFEFFHLFLEDAYVVHEGDDSVGGHGTGVEAGGGQQWSHVERHGALSGVEHEQFTPGQSQQRNLVRHLYVCTRTRHRSHKGNKNSAIADKPRDAFFRSLKVTKHGTIPYDRCGFLLVYFDP